MSARWSVVWTAVVMVWACDDATSVPEPDVPSVADASSDVQPACTADARRCGAEGVEVCRGDGWVRLAACPRGSICELGECVAEPCAPACDGAECGPDGCGGVCGECASGAQCVDGRCTAAARCGDDVCQVDEDCARCPADCGRCCGDGRCDAATENCADCPADCGCAVGEVCDAERRACEACAPQCDGRECGPDACGGTCGACAEGVECDVGRCAACAARCDGRACGDDGCGGACGACPEAQVCDRDGQCVEAPAACGDDACDPDEDCANCPADCGACCGDGACDAAAAESCADCPADCACPGDEVCDAVRRACAAPCQPQCDGRDCGDDGCGGACGECEADQACMAGVCRDLCQPNCEGRACGGDGCGGRCGECVAGELCADGLCVPECQPACADRACGDDGCGDVCGVCVAGELCADGRCVPECQPACAERACGDDGCGDVCGVCVAGELCEDGHCVPECQPACAERACGDDGCGDVCGACVAGELCEDGRCVPECQPACDERACGDDGCGGVCGACDVDEICTPEGRCDVPRVLCRCADDEVCLEGLCRAPEQLCGGANPRGLCPSGEACVTGACRARGHACAEDRPEGVCPVGELCRDGGCVAPDDEALCDDGNPCTADRFDLAANRCAHRSVQAECDDGNGCTVDRCEAGRCVVAERLDGCIEPPTIDPYASPTNVGAFTLSGDKPAGAAIRIDGELAVPADPEARWQVPLNLVPGENLFRVQSADDRGESGAVEVRVVYDLVPPTLEASPRGGVFLEPVTVTVAVDEPATVYYTDDGGTPDQWSKSFRALRRFRVFHDTTLIFRALDDAGNWQEGELRLDFEISGAGSRWRPGPDVPEPREGAAAVQVGDGIYLIGGEDDEGRRAEVDIYDLEAEAWRPGPALPAPLSDHAAAVVGGRPLVVGGRAEGRPTDAVWRLADDAPAWEALPPLPAPRAELAAVHYDGKVHVFGGRADGGGVLDRHAVYDLAEAEWSEEVPQMPRARFGHAAIEHVGRVYLVGGADAEGAPVAEIDVLDIVTGAWTEIDPMPTPRIGATVTLDWNEGVVGGADRGLVVAGGVLADGSPTALTEEWVLSRRVWRERAPLDRPRARGAGVSVAAPGDLDTVERAGWSIGGRVEGALSADVRRYTRDQDHRRPAPALPEGRRDGAAEEVGGLVYLFGGRSLDGPSPVRAFDPETGRVVGRSPMPRTQIGLGSAVIDGRIYAVGGGDGEGLALPWLSVYDPAFDTWSEGRAMPTARAHPAVVALDGRLWVIGGSNNGPLQTVEVYDPRTDEWAPGPVLPAGRTHARAVVHDGDLVVAYGRDAEGPSDEVLRLRNGRWQPILEDCVACEPHEHGQMVLLHDHQLAFFGGRVGDASSDRIYAVNLRDGTEAPALLDEANLFSGVERAATVYHHGRVYLLGGSDDAAEQRAQVQVLLGHCYDGVQGAQEPRVDTGAGCPQLYPEECRTHAVRDSAGRRLQDPAGDRCDRNDEIVGQWFRLEGEGGTRFIFTNPRDNQRCGTGAIGYGVERPSVQRGVVIDPICYHLFRSCWARARIAVRNCGGFYVYRFVELPPMCNASICTE